MSKEKMTWLVVGLVAGIVFSRQISRIPLVDRIPTV